MSDETPPNPLEQLQEKLEQAINEVRNCHILLAILVARGGNGVVITDHEMQNANQLGQLTVIRDDRVPGCVMLVKPRFAS